MYYNTIHNFGQLRIICLGHYVCLCWCIQVYSPVSVHEFNTLRTHWTMCGEDTAWGTCTWTGRAQFIQTRQALQGHIETLLWIFTLSALRPTHTGNTHLTKIFTSVKSNQVLTWQRLLLIIWNWSISFLWRGRISGCTSFSWTARPTPRMWTYGVINDVCEIISLKI